MAYKTCEDCGCRLREGGLCTNCQEELYIYDYQSNGECPFSDEFMEKVAEQRLEIIRSRDE